MLGPGDVPEMLRLAERTHPGPFVRARTSLVNMSASRSTGRLPPWPASACGSTDASRSARSVSAPTTAAKAMRRFSFRGSSASCARRAPRRSLHAFTDNVSAIALYQRLGFKARKTLRLTVLSPASAPYSRPRLSPGPASASARPTSSPRSSIEVCSRTVRSSPFAWRSACSGERATLTVTFDSTSGCR